MNKQAAEPGSAQAHVELRRASVSEAVSRPLHAAAPDAAPISSERLGFFRREAEELYWNELAWEELTEEERVDKGHLTEMVFPGFLAFIDGLLVEHAPADSGAPAAPHPDAVEEILAFLGERYTELRAEVEGGADSQKAVWAMAMTDRLVDLVFYKLYRLTRAERELVEGAGGA
ncbi:MAG: hypothetical protein M3483_00015 [Gemmatimonadota bacterium]|nr:hypothetical protein [Gemmatimonadota bacterium]